MNETERDIADGTYRCMPENRILLITMLLNHHREYSSRWKHEHIGPYYRGLQHKLIAFSPKEKATSLAGLFQCGWRIGSYCARGHGDS